MQRRATTSSCNGNVDYALTKDQTLRIGYNRNAFTNRNLGIGGIRPPERALHATRTTAAPFAHPGGRTARPAVLHQHAAALLVDRQRSAVRARGADHPRQRRVHERRRAGRRRPAPTTLNLASDLDYVRGIHSLRAGSCSTGGWYRPTSTNYLGTYTFESLEAFDAGRAAQLHAAHRRSRTSATGTCRPRSTCRTTSASGASLTVSPGLRYEVQTHSTTLDNVGPRFGVTWAPFKSGKTTLRAARASSTTGCQQHLRADAARRRLPPAGAQHHQSVVSRSDAVRGAIRADQPVPARRRAPAGENTRASALASISAFTPKVHAGVTYAYIKRNGPAARR